MNMGSVNQHYVQKSADWVGPLSYLMGIMTVVLIEIAVRAI